MNRDIYIKLMKFPSEWTEWEMLPVESIRELVETYEPGMENASEHDRHGAFQWWLREQPTDAQLVKLARLSWLDPDEGMGGYVRECIAEQPDLSADVVEVLASPYHRAKRIIQADAFGAA